jgi:hypothetical protein
MNAKSHVGFWLCSVLVLFLCLPLLRQGPELDAFVMKELQLTRDTFGTNTTDWVSARASVVFALYTPSVPLAGARIQGEGMKRTERIVPGPGTAMTHAYNSYVQGLVLGLYVACLRFFIFGVWFLVLLPVFVAAIVDGLVQRAIKRAEFGAIRPAAISLASHAVIPMAMAPLIYLVVPFPVTPLVSPLWALTMAMPLSTLVSNSQPVFGRT